MSSITRSLMNRSRTVALSTVACVLAALSLSQPAGATPPQGVTKLGKHALTKNSGPNNTALGFEAMDPNSLCIGPASPNSCCTGLGKGTCGNAGDSNTAVGAFALQSNTTGLSNTAVGLDTLQSNTTGYWNTAVGSGASKSNTTGAGNVAVGDSALYFDTSGSEDVAVGFGALNINVTGNQNCAVGARALQDNLSGHFNTALGFGALEVADATGNTAIGWNALSSDTTGANNVALGPTALSTNATGNSNTAIGQAALQYSTGSENTALGEGAAFNTTGDGNTVVGRAALLNNTSGNNNIALGASSGDSLASGDNNIYVGNHGAANESNVIRIGTSPTHTATFVAGIRGVTTGSPDAIEVMIDSNGQLGTISSSRRFKTDIRNMGDVSSKLLKLRPVTFRYKKELDPSGTLQYGLIAEEVEQVFPDLVAYGKDGKIETVKYHLLANLLLNEFQKQHRQIEQVQVENATLRAQVGEIGELKARLTALEAALPGAGGTLREAALQPR